MFNRSPRAAEMRLACTPSPFLLGEIMQKVKRVIYKPDVCELKQSDINHLRRLLAWLRCENAYLYLDNQQHAELSKELFAIVGRSEKYEKRIEKAFNRFPLYVHNAVKALGKTIREVDGAIVDVDSAEQKAIEARP